MCSTHGVFAHRAFAACLGAQHFSNDDSLALKGTSKPSKRRARVWLFDLDNTLHDATASSFVGINRRMSEYIVEHLALPTAEADALRSHYWRRYGATLIGLVRHHGVKAAHFLHHTHVLPELESQVRANRADLQALARLPGMKVLLTNAPAAYTQRVLGAMAPRGAARLFDRIVSIEDMAMFGQLRPKPDRRMLRHVAARLKVAPARCVLVEDTLEHLKAVCALGMQTVWMQRWLGQPNPAGVRPRLQRRPAYVQRRVRRLHALKRLVNRQPMVS